MQQKLIVTMLIGVGIGSLLSTYLAYLTVKETDKRFATAVEDSFRDIMDDLVKTTVRNTALWMEFAFGAHSHRLLDPETMGDIMDQTQVTINTFSLLADKDGKLVFLDKDGIPILDFGEKNALQEQVSVFDCKNIDFKTLIVNSGERLKIQKIRESKDKEDYMVATIQLSPMNIQIQGKRFQGNDLVLCVLVPIEEIYGMHGHFKDELLEIERLIIKLHIATFICVFFFVLVLYWVMVRKMAQRIAELARAVEQIEVKNYAVRVKVSGEDEINTLARSFNRMAHEIQDYTEQLEHKVQERTQALEEANQKIVKLNEKLKEDNLRLEAEVVIAKRLQMMMLPKERELNAIKAYEIVGFMQPAERVGGDYYDVICHDDQDFIRVGIGDVTGHGLESGVLMLMVQTIAKTLFESGLRDPVQFLEILNRVVYANNHRMETDKSLTLLFADFAHNQIRLTGQHEEVIVLRKQGCLERFQTMDLGLPIGLVDSVQTYTASQEIAFNDGDTLILYTDGITEAENEMGQLYGMERLCDLIQNHRSADAKSLRETILKDVFAFMGQKPVLDDISLLIIKKKESL